MADDVLGSGDNEASIATRDGRTILMSVPAKSIEWNRNLCAISRASVVVEPAKCTPKLAEVHPWAHSLVIHRNGERVWEGPVRTRRDSANGLTFNASDVLGILERREVIAGRKSIGSTVRGHMSWAVTQAFAGDDPNVMAYLQLLGSAIATGDLTVTRGEKLLAAVLGEMTGLGGRWTALGRSILLWDTSHVLGQLRDLSPENHLLSDVEVVEDGDLLTTRVMARNDKGVVGAATPTGVPSTGIDPFYGLVGQVVASTGTNPAGVRSTAQAMARKGYPTPLTIEVPGDAALRCDAPFPIERLVPGVMAPVSTTTATSLTIRSTFMLSSVKVTQTAGEDEKVGITLTPPSAVTE